MATVPPFPITLQGVKQKLIGLRPWFTAAALEGYDDPYMQDTVLPARVRRWEEESQSRLLMCQVVSATQDDGVYSASPLDPTGQYVIPVVRSNGQFYTEQDAYEYFRIACPEKPVALVQRIRLCLNSYVVFTIPSAWNLYNTETSKYWIAPITGMLQIASATAIFQAFNLAFRNMNYIPQAIQMDYIVGYPIGWQSDPNNAALVRHVEEYCALGLLEDIAHLADAGLSVVNVSADGVSEQRNYTRFADRKAELEQSTSSYIELRKEQDVSIPLAFV